MIQEELFLSWKSQGDLSLGWFLTFFQCAIYSAFNFVLWDRSKEVKTLLSTKERTRLYIVIGTLSLLTIGLSNSAVELLNYPTQVVFKTCKPVSVMVLG